MESHTLPSHWDQQECMHAWQHVISLYKSYRILYNPDDGVCNLIEHENQAWEQIARAAHLNVPQCRYIIRSKKGDLKKLYCNPKHWDPDTGRFLVQSVRGRLQLFNLTHFYWIIPYMDWGRDANLRDISLQLNVIEHMKQESETPAEMNTDVREFGFHQQEQPAAQVNLMGGNNQQNRRMQYQYGMTSQDENYDPNAERTDYDNYDQSHGYDQSYENENSNDGYYDADNPPEEQYFDEQQVAGTSNNTNHNDNPARYSNNQSAKKMRTNDNYIPSAAGGPQGHLGNTPHAAARGRGRPRGRGRGGSQPDMRGMSYKASPSAGRGVNSRGGLQQKYTFRPVQRPPPPSQSSQMGNATSTRTSNSFAPPEQEHAVAPVASTSFDRTIREELGSDSQKILDIKNKLLAKTFVPHSRMDSFVLFLRQMLLDLENPNLIDLAISRCAQVLADIYCYKFEIHSGQPAPDFDHRRRCVDGDTEVIDLEEPKKGSPCKSSHGKSSDTKPSNEKLEHE